MILADTSVNPLELGQFLLMMGAVAALYLKIRSAAREMAGRGELREISPQPLEVTEAKAPATLRDVARVEKRVVRLEGEVQGMKRDNETARDKMHDEMRDLRDRMSDQFQSQGETLRTIERALGRLEGS